MVAGGQGFVEALQHLVQPQTEITFVHGGIQLVHRLQAELAHRKEPVGAIAQIFIRARRQMGHWHQSSHRQWRENRGRCNRAAQPRIVGQRRVVSGQLHLLHQHARQQSLTGVVAAAPQHITKRCLQRMLPGCQLGGLQVVTRRQPQGGALDGGPTTRGLGRGVQPHLVTACQHHGRKRTAQHLAHWQDRQLLTQRVWRLKAGALQGLVDPVCELRQIHASRRPQRLLRQGIPSLQRRARQPQDRQRLNARFVHIQIVPKAAAPQRCTQGRQPARKRTAALQAIAYRVG